MPKTIYSLKSFRELLEKEKPSKVVVVTSKKLAPRFGWALKEIGLSKKDLIFIPDGEHAKEWSVVEGLLKKFISFGLDRRSIVIALGGGSIGDPVGFACAIYLRGIRYVQVPTTLLSQVDSAHGGKTGINFSNYKNQVGAFHLPIAIVLEKRFLRSLPREQIIDGLGEIIKAGLIKDPSILRLLKEQNVSSLAAGKNIGTLVRKAIWVKQSYVDQDPKDTGARQILNFGHTIGHTLELKYKISHGRAVLIGMVQELRIAEHLGITPSSVRKNLLDLLNILGIRVETDLKTDAKTILRDKKIAGKTIELPIVEKEGRARLLKIATKDLRSRIDAIGQ